MRFDAADGRRGACRWKVAAATAAAVLGVGCSEEAPRQTAGGMLSGQVVISGPLRKATISVDQLDLSVTSSVAVRAHVGDTTTDDDGRFSIDTSTYSGLLLVTAKGGSYTDLATGATIQLDPGVGLESIEPLELLEQRDDALVSPIGALLAARTRWKMTQLHDLTMAERDAEDHVARHFAGVPWTRVKLSTLDTSATSPTEPIRAGLVHAALSYLAADIAQAAGASPQEVNVLLLTQQLAADIASGPFDGNDGNSTVLGEGLQVGACPAVTNCTAPPGTTCTLGACRPLCDLYAGTPRALLAGEVTKVIQSPMVNHTGLVTGDILAVARSMADNVDDDLFGQACLENLDRLPPKLDWAMPTPADGAFVRAAFQVRAVAVDDTDPHPQVTIDGYPSTPADSAAMAMIDSTKTPDGMLVVSAEAHDMAGNATMIQRAIRVDNTPPTLALDPTGFLQDGSTWWTATASPILMGTVGDASPVNVATSTPAGSAAATVTGSTWSGGVAGALDLSGADVVVSATDAAGNATQITQHIRADLTPPTLTLTGGDVRDEANEVPTFDPNEIPVHIHTGTRIDLTASGACPAFTKFSYLLAGSPPYANEVTGQNTPDPNPVHYMLSASDDGVGVVTTSIQYRVGYQAMGTTTWLLDWTSATGAPTRNPGEYDIKILSDQVPQLATTEGVYNVEFRASDRLMRTTSMARCFELHLRAPPLHLQTPGGVGDSIPVHHTYELASMALGSSPISARLLNDDSTGASLLDEDLTNGTGSTVYLDVGITVPTEPITAGQRFQIDHDTRNVRTTNIDCSQNPDNPPPAICTLGVPAYVSVDSGEQPVNNPSIFVKVFELDSTQAPATEVACQTCGNSGHWEFAIPPRPGSATALAPPRRFKVMTMIGQIAQLWPADNSHPAMPPFREAVLNSVAFTGLTSTSFDVCSQHSRHTQPDGTIVDTCTRLSTVTPFRALILAHLKISGVITSIYSTAATVTAVPVAVGSPRFFSNASSPWTIQQMTLPCTGISC